LLPNAGYEDGDYDGEEEDEAVTTRHPNSVLPFGVVRDTTSSPKDNLPRFAVQPQNAYVIKERQVELTCAAVNADKAYFVCNGEAMAASPKHKEVTSSDGDLVTRELSFKVSRDDVEEFFGKFRCRCDAWSSAGRTQSKSVVVETACE